MMVQWTYWEPLCFLQGRKHSDGLFWLLFWAVAKESLAIKGETSLRNNDQT